MYTLYGRNGSGSAAIEAALAIIGAPSASSRRLRGRRTRPYAELLEVNPLGRYRRSCWPMAARFRKARQSSFISGSPIRTGGLLPRDDPARAQAIRGLVFIAANCYAAIASSIIPRRWCEDADEATQKRIRAGTRARLHQYWKCSPTSFRRVLISAEAIWRARPSRRRRVEMVGGAGASAEGTSDVLPKRCCVSKRIRK
jgi:GST-like protein